MEEIGVWLAAIAIAIPAGCLIMAMRHMIPLVRGVRGPSWVYFLGPIIMLSDRFFIESARPHRLKAATYVGLGIGTSLFLMLLSELIRR